MSQTFPQLVSDLVDRPGALLRRFLGTTALGLDESPEAALGVGAGDAILLASLADLADLLVDEAAVHTAPAPVVRAVLHVEMAAAVGALHAATSAAPPKLAPPVQKIIPV
jgi:hypothetical protein